MHRTIGAGDRRVVRRSTGRALRDAGAAFHPRRGLAARVRLSHAGGRKVARVLRERRRRPHCRDALAVADRLGDGVSAAERSGTRGDARRRVCGYTERFVASGEAYERAASHAATDGTSAVHSPRRRQLHLGPPLRRGRRCLRRGRRAGTRARAPRGGGARMSLQAFHRGRHQRRPRRFCPQSRPALAPHRGGERRPSPQAHASFAARPSNGVGDYAQADPRRASRRSRSAARCGRPILLFCQLVHRQGALLPRRVRRARSRCSQDGDAPLRRGSATAPGGAGCSTRSAGASPRSASRRARELQRGATRLAPRDRRSRDPRQRRVNLALNHLWLGDWTMPPRISPLCEPSSRCTAIRGCAGARASTSPTHRASWRSPGAIPRARSFTPTPSWRTLARSLRKLVARAHHLRARALVAQDRRDEAVAAIDATLAVATAIAYPAGTWRALRLRAEIARRNGRTDEVRETVARAEAIVATLARSLPDGELVRALYAASSVGHDKRP